VDGVIRDVSEDFDGWQLVIPVTVRRLDIGHVTSVLRALGGPPGRCDRRLSPVGGSPEAEGCTGEQVEVTTEGRAGWKVGRRWIMGMDVFRVC
jgi:hypothetical protein